MKWPIFTIVLSLPASTMAKSTCSDNLLICLCLLLFFFLIIINDKHNITIIAEMCAQNVVLFCAFSFLPLLIAKWLFGIQLNVFIVFHVPNRNFDRFFLVFLHISLLSLAMRVHCMWLRKTPKAKQKWHIMNVDGRRRNETKRISTTVKKKKREKNITNEEPTFVWRWSNMRNNALLFFYFLFSSASSPYVWFYVYSTYVFACSAVSQSQCMAMASHNTICCLSIHSTCERAIVWQ